MKDPLSDDPVSLGVVYVVVVSPPRLRSPPGPPPPSVPLPLGVVAAGLRDDESSGEAMAAARSCAEVGDDGVTEMTVTQFETNGGGLMAASPVLASLSTSS